MAKRIVTNKDIIDIIKQGKNTVNINLNTIITPLAMDTIKENRIKISKSAKPVNSNLVPIVAANWKMNMTSKRSIDYITKFKINFQISQKTDIVFFPPFTYLSELKKNLKYTSLSLGGQNFYSEPSGAYTGEVSISMLKDVGCEYVLIGHSERRHIFNESLDCIRKKLEKAVKDKINIILCIGETLEDRETNRTFETIGTQLYSAIKDIPTTDITEHFDIAYEPVWAIGTGKTASREQIIEVHKFIKLFLTRIKNIEFAEKIRIMYGGSIKPDNIETFINSELINGLLVGGASLNPVSFTEIIKKFV